MLFPVNSYPLKRITVNLALADAWGTGDTPERTCPSGLEAANARAYEAGYQTAYAGYRDLSERYIAEVKKPRIRLPSAIALLGAAGVGVLLGRVVP